MLQRLGIRGKILAVVAVPILVLLLAGGYITYAAVSSLIAASTAEQLVDTAAASQEFQSDLNAERDAGVNFVDAYTDGLSARAASRASIAQSQATLPADVQSELDSLYANAGSMSLNDARAVAPTGFDADDPESWYVWPEADAATAAVESMNAISAAVDAYGEQLSGDTADVVNDIAFQLQTEAIATEQFLSVPRTFQERFIAAVDATDDSYRPFESRVNDIPVNDANASVNSQTSLIAQQMAAIDDTRESVRTVGNSANGVSGNYDRTAESVNELLTRFALAAGDPELSLQLTAYAAVDELFRQLGLESTLNERILRAGTWGPGDVDFARRQSNQTDFARNEAEGAVEALETGLEVPQWGASSGGNANQDFESVRGTVGSGDQAELATIRGVPWTEMVAQEAEAQRPAYDGTVAMANTTADALRSAALFQMVVTALAVAIAVVLSVIIALVIARRIVVPLRRLTTTATAVRAELPRLVERVAIPGETVDVAEVQIPVESRDEVGRLAEAFNGVNAATLAIASEQAALRGSISEMFVNVARRDQVLLNRQLASIDDMERTQDDPDTLTKLFALDHLATRMRRNSESLLVLAGIDTGRRLRRAMPLSDVIRTASSEIELYERVQLELDADPAMLGHSALTAAHLFAELLENATVFSDPGSPVVVRTREEDGNYIVEIQDSGIGMTESELGEANSRVASTAASEILGAQRLGLFVVGRIARRIGARVRIESKEGAGTTAFVTMTPSLFDPSYNADVVHHTESTVNEKLHAPAALVAHNSENEEFDVPTKAADSGAYQPAVVEGAPLVSRVSDEESVSDLIAADAAAAPVGTAVSGAELTDGVSAIGLPTRRRRDTPVEVSAEEQRNVIGLPARATDAQLSALEAEAPAESFTPAIPASEIAPQTPEDRAQMFRGFRSRREIADTTPMADPEAESLGHAARRGGLAAEDLLPAAAAAAMVIPMLEDDEYAPQAAAVETPVETPVVDAVEPAAAEPTFEPADAPLPMEFHMPRLEVDPGISAGFGGDDDAPFEPNPALVVPLLEDDEEAPAAVHTEPAPAPPTYSEPVVEAPAAEPAYQAEQYQAEPYQAEPYQTEPYQTEQYQAAPAYQAEAPATDPAPVASDAAPSESAVPFGYADVYGSLPSPTPAPQNTWGVDSVSLGEPGAQQEPTLDELIAGATDEEAVKSGFFSRLFGRSKKEKAPEPAAPAVAVAAAAAPSAFPGVTEPVVDTAPAVETPAPTYDPAPAFEPAPSYDAPAPAPAYEPAPSYDAPAPTYDPAPAYEPAQSYEPAPAYQAPAPTSFEPAPAEHREEPVSPGGAFALWSNQTQPQSFSPTPAEAPTAGQSFTPDELANPFGWESAGASALAAASPEAATEYHPVLDAQPDLGTEGAEQAELTSAVFSEFSSLAMERPKVEKTRAGLQRRRSADAPAPEVTPIAAEVQISHKDRDADEVRSRFSSFYSGTQRARSDVAEFEQRSQSGAGKE